MSQQPGKVGFEPIDRLEDRSVRKPKTTGCHYQAAQDGESGNYGQPTLQARELERCTDESGESAQTAIHGDSASAVEYAPHSSGHSGGVQREHQWSAHSSAMNAA